MRTRITAEELLENPDAARAVARHLRYEAPDYWLGGHDGFLEKMARPGYARRATLKQAEYLANLSNKTLEHTRLGGYSIAELVKQLAEICIDYEEEFETFISEIKNREPIFVRGTELKRFFWYCRRHHLIGDAFIRLN